jgi:hypothetical protein
VNTWILDWTLNIQCVHKVHSGFWKIVARKQIELATCGLRQITAKLWKFFFDPDRWIKWPSLRFSVSCLWNGHCAGTRPCVGWLFEIKSAAQTQPPSDYAIRDWQLCFPETGSVHDRKRSGRPGVSDECVETIRASFVRSPAKSTRRASRELLLPRSTIHKVLHNTQFFKTPSGLCGHTVYLTPSAYNN